MQNIIFQTIKDNCNLDQIKLKDVKSNFSFFVMEPVIHVRILFKKKHD